MITRRELLIRATSIAGLQLINPLASLAQEQPARPFLYTLEDYINPTKQPAEMGRLYLDELQEPSAVVAWATWCGPCVDKIPTYNEFYQRYGEKIRFMSALLQDNIDFVPRTPPMRPAEYLASCMNNSLVSKYGFGSEAYQQSIKQLREDKINSPELAEMIRFCEENTREAYHPTPSRPRERQELKESINRLKQNHKWPLFPTYVLDDKTTSQYLGGESAFFVTLFKNRKKIKTLEGAGEKKIERELKRLL